MLKIIKKLIPESLYPSFLLMFKHQYWKSLPSILVLLCCLASVVLSFLESRVNTDAHHWGLMYANAADLHAGLLPYRQIFIQYGVLTTLLQSFSLSLFGNCMVSIGIMTGIFYAANIFLSFCLWKKFMSHWLAALSAMIMFLVHGYIIYPWSNYFSYTFFLISLLFLLAPHCQRKGYFMTGLFLGLSFLARQSLMPLLVPLYAYFLLLLVTASRDNRKTLFQQIFCFHLGLVTILALFFLYLLHIDALNDWVAQSVTLLSLYTVHLGGEFWIFTTLFKGIFLAQSGVGTDERTLLYSLLFFNALVIFGVLLRKVHRRKITEIGKIMFLLSAVTLCGYLQSMHIYEVFRLQSAASLGFGLLVFSIDRFSMRWEHSRNVIFSIIMTFLVTSLGLSMLFTKTTSVYFRWHKSSLFNKNFGEPEHVEIFRHTLYDDQTRLFYQTLDSTLRPYVGKIEYVVNFTKNSTFLMLAKSFKKVQRSPFYSPQLSELIFQDEQLKTSELLAHGEAVLLAEKQDQIPKNYKIIQTLQVPVSIPWMEHPSVYVAVPSGMTGTP